MNLYFVYQYAIIAWSVGQRAEKPKKKPAHLANILQPKSIRFRKEVMK
jgi:hypothetical protein